MFRVPGLNGLQNVLEAAVRVDEATCGLLMLTAGDDTLRVVAQVDAAPELVAHANSLRLGDGSATGQAASERRRVVIRDVALDPGLGHHRASAEAAGVQAIQATPLIDRDRKIRGVLTTFYPTQHHPSTDSLRYIDLCGRVAGLLIEVVRLHDAMVAADREMGIPQRALSPSAAQAADAARVLLPSISKRHSGEGLLVATEKHLTIVADELASYLRKHAGNVR